MPRGSGRFAVLLIAFMVSGVLVAAQQSTGGRDTANSAVDRIVIVKSTRTMTLQSSGRVLKTYKVALGNDPIGAKDREGDHKTPEGEYFVDGKNAHSRFYLALHISYPSASDRSRAKQLGVAPGGDVEFTGWERSLAG